MVLIPSGMIGGDLLSGVGGYIRVWQSGQDTNYATGNRLDVGEWRVRKMHINAECTHTGCLGSLNYRRVAIGWRFACQVLFDLTKVAPRPLLHSCNTIKIRFNLGNPIEGQYPPGYGTGQWQYYYSPAALLEEVHTVSNAAKDVIRQDVTGIGTSHIFLFGGALEDNNETAEFNTYKALLAAQGWSV